MFERYREDAKRAIFFARWEAQQSGSAYIDAQHILLALTHDADSKANQLFGLSPHKETFREQLGVKTSAKSSQASDLPLSNPSKRVLAYAAEEANRLASTPIGTEHLLLGLLREKHSDVPKTLANAGIDLRSARDLIGAAQGPSARVPEPDNASVRLLRPFAAFFLLVAALSLLYLIFRLANS